MAYAERLVFAVVAVVALLVLGTVVYFAAYAPRRSPTQQNQRYAADAPVNAVRTGPGEPQTQPAPASQDSQLESAPAFVEYRIHCPFGLEIDTIMLIAGERPAFQEAWWLRKVGFRTLDLFEAYKRGEWAGANRILLSSEQYGVGRLSVPIRFERTWLPQDRVGDTWWAMVPQRGVFPAVVDQERAVIGIERPLNYAETTIEIVGPWPPSPRLLVTVWELDAGGHATGPWEYRVYADADRFFSLYLPPGRYEIAIAKDKPHRTTEPPDVFARKQQVEVGRSGAHVQLDTPDRDW